MMEYPWDIDGAVPSLTIEGIVADFPGVMTRTFYQIEELRYDKRLPLESLESAVTIYPNTGLILKDGSKSALALVKGNEIVLVQKDYRPCNIEPRNAEQRLALAMLADDSIDLVTITGKSGSGKTFLAIAHAMQQLRAGKVKKIVIAKSLVPVGREVGFLKGDLSEKVRPWLGNFYDNLEALGIGAHEVEAMLDPMSKNGYIEISPLTFIQGRSIGNAIVIVDEAQNLSKEVMHQIVTRPAEGTKLILLGDTAQVFERGLSGDSNGLSWIVEKGQSSEIVAHINLPHVERSRLAEWAAGLTR